MDEAVIEVYVDSGLLCFQPRNCKYLFIAVDANNLGIGLCLLNQKR